MLHIVYSGIWYALVIVWSCVMSVASSWGLESMACGTKLRPLWTSLQLGSGRCCTTQISQISGDKPMIKLKLCRFESSWMQGSHRSDEFQPSDVDCFRSCNQEGIALYPALSFKGREGLGSVRGAGIASCFFTMDESRWIKIKHFNDFAGFPR